MNNIKTIEVIKPTLGLNVGDTLSREDANSNFTHKSEVIGDDYSSTSSISVSENYIDIDNFRIIEWFSMPMESVDLMYSDMKDEIEKWKSEYYKLNDNLDLYKERIDLINKRVYTKIEEYKQKLSELDKEMNDKFISGESIEWADEAFTVYHNMVELLEKIIA